MHGTSRRWAALAVAVMVRMMAGDEAWASDEARRRIVVSLADRQLVVLDHDTVVRVFPVAVGRSESPSPVGVFTVTDRIPNPTYYTTGKVVRPGATNPLGTRWIGLSVKGYGIHGTDVPSSIGHARSHGCIRLRNRDVEELFNLVRGGDVVEVLPEATPEVSVLFAAARNHARSDLAPSGNHSASGFARVPVLPSRPIAAVAPLAAL
jgi:lipoprotein-anchoring transpeptidase ErfK/SrfK